MIRITLLLGLVAGAAALGGRARVGSLGRSGRRPSLCSSRSGSSGKDRIAASTRIPVARGPSQASAWGTAPSSVRISWTRGSWRANPSDPGGVSVKKRLARPGFLLGKRFRDGGIIMVKRPVGPRLFLGKRFGHGGVVVRKKLDGPHFLAGARFGDTSVVIRKGFVGPQFFRGKRFGEQGVVVRKGLGGPPFFGVKRFRVSATLFGQTLE